MSLTGDLKAIPVVGPLGEDIGAGAAKALYPVHTTQSNLSRAAQVINVVATRWKISPDYLWGIFGVETSYGTQISVSTTGARGPFQFEPATARQYRYPLGINEHSITNWGAFTQQADAAA